VLTYQRQADFTQPDVMYDKTSATCLQSPFFIAPENVSHDEVDVTTRYSDSN